MKTQELIELLEKYPNIDVEIRFPVYNYATKKIFYDELPISYIEQDDGLIILGCEWED